MFSRLFRDYRPAECIQFYCNSNQILYEQIVSSNSCFEMWQPSVRSQRMKLILVHADQIRLTAEHKIGSNWLTQEACSKEGRGCE